MKKYKVFTINNETGTEKKILAKNFFSSKKKFKNKNQNKKQKRFDL